MQIKTFKGIMLGLGFTLVGAESAELMHLMQPPKHIDVELNAPLDLGKFRYGTVVTTTTVTSSGPVFIRPM
jgi:hypothetical protein